MSQTKTPPVAESPEATGQYECPSCHNRERFTGKDAHGYGGPEACEEPGNCPNGTQDNDESFCGCMTELRQDFDVRSQGESAYEADIHYHAHEGGESGSEIGSYTGIICRDCGHTIWQEAENVA